jgi:uncharacterized membrane protein
MLIPFPVAFLVATLVCDLIFWRTGNPAWSTASLYLLGAALIMAALAAIAGLTDFLGDERIRDLSAVWHHIIGNVVVVLLSLWNRYRRYETGEAAVLPIGFVISLVVVLLLLYTGWRGWESYCCKSLAVDHEGILAQGRGQTLGGSSTHVSDEIGRLLGRIHITPRTVFGDRRRSGHDPRLCRTPVLTQRLGAEILCVRGGVHRQK